MDAETASVGVIAIFIAGFALAMIPTVEIPDHNECNCSAWDDKETMLRVVAWLYVLGLAYVAIFAGACTIFVAMFDWQGKKLLSKRSSKVGIGGPISQFNMLYDDPGFEHDRKTIRKRFWSLSLIHI